MQALVDWDLIQPLHATGAHCHNRGEATLDLAFEALQQGRYQDVLSSAVGQRVLGFEPPATANRDATEIPGTDVVTRFYQNHIGAWLSSAASAEAQQTVRYQVLVVGVALLQLFIQQCWTGPPITVSLDAILPECLLAAYSTPEKWAKQTLRSLEIDGEQPYHLTRDPILLFLARVLLVDVLCQLDGDATSPITVLLNEQLDTTVTLPIPPSMFWWAARCLRVQQTLLDEKSSTLSNQIHTLLQHTATVLQSPACQANGASQVLPAARANELCARLALEQGLVEQYYERHDRAIVQFQKAQEASGLQWSVTGALGRRTKFQQFDVSQLVVVAESARLADENSPAAADPISAQPEALLLNDDTLLEQTQFRDTASPNAANGYSATSVDPTKQGSLRAIDQCILLAFCLNVKNTNPDDGLTQEQMKPYVARVLANANNWMVHTMGLVLRSRLESQSSRTVERAALQLQALVDQMPSEESSVVDRHAYFYTLLLPSWWDMEKELAHRFVSLGVVRSALDIFKRLEMWDEVIACLQMLEKDDEAEALVREQLTHYPDSPRLYCILGDLKTDPSYWEKAWTISNNRFARAMRSLGGYYFRQTDYSRSIECYNKALKLNPLFENTWFLLGCAGMRCEDWNTAVQAFVRVVSLDHGNGEAWNNLASCYLRLERFRDAFNAFQQAARRDFENWKIWTNYLYVALEVGHYAEAIHALRHLVDLRYTKVKEECLDVAVLNKLVQAAIRDVTDIHGQSVASQANMLERLLVETITPRITTVPRVWKICADFWFWRKAYAKALDCQLKAYRCYVTNPTLDHSEEVFTQTAEAALDLVDVLRNLGPRPDTEAPRSAPNAEPTPVAADWNYQARLILRSLIARTKPNFEEHQLHDQLKEALRELKANK
ncbi:hypothetical protein H4R35_001155 [Dimargaris xerosporica]|nr:hypothetical protein H4R35_001155 [Dimargaris xerosporica]